MNIISQIASARSIPDYLDSKGIKSVAHIGNRFKYLCPFHRDTSPSFYVFVKGDGEMRDRYYCFGCGAHGDIIKLKAELEGVPVGTAIAKLGEGMDLTFSPEEAEYQYEQEKRIRYQNTDPLLSHSLQEYTILISNLIYSYLSRVKDIPEEVVFVNKFLQLVDKAIVALDIDTVHFINENLGWLKERDKKRKEKMRIESVAASDKENNDA